MTMFLRAFAVVMFTAAAGCWFLSVLTPADTVSFNAALTGFMFGFVGLVATVGAGLWEEQR